MSWRVSYLPEVDKDMNTLESAQRLRVRKVIKRVSENPLPVNEGGYGKPLGNKADMNLTGLLKIKLRSDGIRVIYKVMRTETEMRVMVVGIREDEEVYDIAWKRRIKYDL